MTALFVWTPGDAIGAVLLAMLLGLYIAIKVLEWWDRQ